MAVKRKEDRLQELREAVKMVQIVKTEERENGTKRVRRMAKEDPEARPTLTMLGAIPPLIPMIDDGHCDSDGDVGESQVEALYALLNLGIGNDLQVVLIFYLLHHNRHHYHHQQHHQTSSASSGSSIKTKAFPLDSILSHSPLTLMLCFASPELTEFSHYIAYLVGDEGLSVAAVAYAETIRWQQGMGRGGHADREEGGEGERAEKVKIKF